MHKELVYLKGFAKGREYWQMLKAISIAIMLHDGQMRKGGGDYIEHPMKVCSELVALKIFDEVTLTAALLHDVIEDHHVSHKDLEDYGFSQEVIDLVLLLTKNKEKKQEFYYEQIRRDPRAILIKISDRCHNLSTMVGAFSIVKINNYISDTEKHVLPLCKFAINEYPQYSDQIVVMRNHIQSILVLVNWAIAQIPAKEENQSVT